VVETRYVNGNIVFYTNHLSEFIIKHTPGSGGTPPTDPTSPSTPGSPVVASPNRPPQTGDDHNAAFWWTILLASALGLTLTIIWRKYMNSRTKWERLVEKYRK